LLSPSATNTIPLGIGRAADIEHNDVNFYDSAPSYCQNSFVQTRNEAAASGPRVEYQFSDLHCLTAQVLLDGKGEL